VKGVKKLVLLNLKNNLLSDFMADLYLEFMLKGGEGHLSAGSGNGTDKGPLYTSMSISPHRNKDRFELAAEKQIESQLNLIDFEAECAGNKLVTPALKRAQKKAELQDAFKKEEKRDLLKRAVDIVNEEGKEILDKEGNKSFEKIEDTFDSIEEKLEELDLDGDLNQNFQSLLHIDGEILEALDRIAIHMFINLRYVDCIGLSTLLYTLVPENPLYFYRAGMAAQNNGDRTSALEAYASALVIDPHLIGAQLFTAECYLAAGERDKAEVHIEKSKAIVAEGSVDAAWIELLEQLDTCI
jgi:tetratricopeptide (TPR) repeat protein